MATRLICDICGKEIGVMDRRYDLDLKSSYFTEKIVSSYCNDQPVHMDLCYKCCSNLSAAIEAMKDGTFYIKE